MSSMLVFVAVAGGVVGAATPRRPPRRHRPVVDATGSARVVGAAPDWWRDLVLLHAPATDAARSWTTAQQVAAGTAAASLLLVGPVPALALVAAAVVGPRLVRPALQRRLAARRDAQLPAALERLAAALRAGAAPGPAFVELARATPAPLGADLRAAAAALEHGSPLGDVIDSWGQRAPTPDVRLATAALALAARIGGPVARPVDRVASTLRERRELQAEVRALATQARASALVLTIAPAAFTALVSTIEPGVPRFLFGSPAGLACLGGGLALQAAGAAWSARILRSAT